MSPSYSRILLRVPNWLGDSMMATPAVAAVHRLFPKARLTVLAKEVFADLWSGFPGVRGVIPLRRGVAAHWKTVEEIRGRDFDIALTLPSSFSSAFLFFAAGIPERVGWGGEGREPFLTRVVPHPSPRERHLVWEYLDLIQEGLGKRLPVGAGFKLLGPITRKARAGLRQIWEDTDVGAGKGFIALSPGATYGPAKRWPLANWRKLVERILAARKERILILGGLEEEAYLRPLLEAEKAPAGEGRLHLLAGRTTPEILLAMLSRCRLLVTNDTGPMHAAAAAGTPVVALFGSTSPVWTRPFGAGHEVIHKRLECSPCFQRTCPIGYKCLHAIGVEEVFRKVTERLRRPRKLGPEKMPPKTILSSEF